MPGSGSSDSDSTRFGECRVYDSSGFAINQNFVDGGAMFGSAVGDNFGHSVSLNYDGSIVAVSSPQFDVVGAIRVGRVQVFQRFEELWVQLGSDLIGNEYDDLFGTSIDLSGDGKTLVAGSRLAGPKVLILMESGKVIGWDLVSPFLVMGLKSLLEHLVMMFLQTMILLRMDLSKCGDKLTFPHFLLS
eukprot:Sro2234_g320151.1  (188) ;mRNA; r:9342-10065